MGAQQSTGAISIPPEMDVMVLFCYVVLRSPFLIAQDYVRTIVPFRSVHQRIVCQPSSSASKAASSECSLIERFNEIIALFSFGKALP